MASTTLQTFAGDIGAATVSEYRGATTASRFTDSHAELDALRTSCGVYDLGFRARLSITGRDRIRWLNGMITNNIRDLAVGQGVYAFLLNPQGHILGDLYAYNRGESFFVDTDQSQVEKILSIFDHYIIMDQVEVKNLNEELTAIGVAGPKAREVLQAAGIEIADTHSLQIFDAKCTCDCDCTTCIAVRSDNTEQEAYELWLAPKDVKKTWQALVAHGAAAVGSEALELQRILNGIPQFGVDIRERDLPQETEQIRALNFSKGCYIGQEIVERIRSRGAVHRRLSGFVSAIADALRPGAKVVVGEKEIGEITSTCALATGSSIALGYIRREASANGKEVFIDGKPARVADLPFKNL